MVNVVVDFDGVIVLDGDFLGFNVAVFFDEGNLVAAYAILEFLFAGFNAGDVGEGCFPFVAGAVGKELIVVAVVVVLVHPGAEEDVYVVNVVVAGSESNQGKCECADGAENFGGCLHFFVIVLMFNE